MEDKKVLIDFPDTSFTNSKEWQELFDITETDYHGHCCVPDGEDTSHINSRGGYENEVFAIRPYWWGDSDDRTEIEAPNFIYKPTDFKIWWYKYPFRGSSMNQDLCIEEIRQIIIKCINSVKNAK